MGLRLLHRGFRYFLHFHFQRGDHKIRLFLTLPNLQPIFMNYKPQWYICGNWLWMIIKYVVSMITKLGDETLQPSVCLLIHPISQPTNHPFLISYECVWLSVCPSIHSSHIPIIMSPREAETECWLSLDNHLNCFLSFFHIHTRSPTQWWKIHPSIRGYVHVYSKWSRADPFV